MSQGRNFESIWKWEFSSGISLCSYVALLSGKGGRKESRKSRLTLELNTADTHSSLGHPRLGSVQPSPAQSHMVNSAQPCPAQSSQALCGQLILVQPSPAPSSPIQLCPAQFNPVQPSPAQKSLVLPSSAQQNLDLPSSVQSSPVSCGQISSSQPVQSCLA